MRLRASRARKKCTMTWTKDDVKNAEDLTVALMKFIHTAEAKKIKAAGEHAETGLSNFFKSVIKDHTPEALKAAIKKQAAAKIDQALVHYKSSSKSEKAIALVSYLSGASTGKALAEAMTSMRKKGNNAALMRSDKSKVETTKPYNFLANQFANYLEGKSQGDENKIFLTMFSFQASVGASIAAGPAGAGLEGLVKLAAKGVLKLGLKGIEWVSDNVVEKLSKDDFKEAFKELGVEPLAWAVYLSAPPRAPSAVENCRLALRVSLGMPYDSTILTTEHKNFAGDESRGDKADCKDVAALFQGMTDADAKKVAANFKKIEEFSKNKKHIAHLQNFLMAMDVWDYLTADKHPYILS